MGRLDPFFAGMLFEDTPKDRKQLQQRVISDMSFPETGWRPPETFPNIRDAKWIGVDCETFDPELGENGPGWARGKGHIVGISLAVQGGKWYFPMRHELQKEMNLDPQKVLDFVQWALTGPGVKIGANFIYDLGWLAEEGVKIPRTHKLYDVQIAEALINETSNLGLDDLGHKHLDRGKTSDTLKDWCLAAYGGPKTLWRANIYRAPVSLAGPYAEDDADMPAQILQKQWPLLSQNELLPLFELECKLMSLLVAMRFQGIQVDVEYAEKLSKQFDEESKQVLFDIRKEFGINFEVNPNSNDSMAKAFDYLGLKYNRTAPTERAPDGNPSFTADFMKTVDHPFAKQIQHVKHLAKLDSTFLQGGIISKHVNGKIFCSFSQMKSDKGGARTGRFASSDPNLQNIPTRTKYGQMIREAFIMDHGHKQIKDGDYSQIEYRMLAHFATGGGADDLRARYNNDPNLDYHNLVGGMVKEITGIELIRSYVKNVNFGIVYGVGVAHLAEMLGLSVADARNLLKEIHTAIPFAKQTMDDLSAEVNRFGIVKTILGRISHFDEWEPIDFDLKKADNFHPLPFRHARAEWGIDIQRAYLYRALNYRLQGSAADMIKKGMVDCWMDGIFDETGVPRLQVHDELLFSDPGDVRPEAWKAMQHTMENCIPEMSIPIRFDMSEGANWKVAH